MLRRALAVAAGADPDEGAAFAPPDGRLAGHPGSAARCWTSSWPARGASWGARLIGLYGGSLAIGDFAPDRSDVDFVAVTDGEIEDDDVSTLATLHARLAAGPSRWGDELRACTCRAALVAPGLRAIRQPYIDRGTGSLGVIATEAGYWEIQRWLLREHGIAVAGPSLRDAIGPVGPGLRLRAAVVDILREWWLPMLADPDAPLGLAVRLPLLCRAVLTMCRMLYTLAHGTIVTKPAAARWAAATLGPRWTPRLFDRARSLGLRLRRPISTRRSR